MAIKELIVTLVVLYNMPHIELYELGSCKLNIAEVPHGLMEDCSTKLFLDASWVNIKVLVQLPSPSETVPRSDINAHYIEEATRRGRGLLRQLGIESGAIVERKTRRKKREPMTLILGGVAAVAGTSMVLGSLSMKEASDLRAEVMYLRKVVQEIDDDRTRANKLLIKMTTTDQEMWEILNTTNSYLKQIETQLDSRIAFLEQSLPEYVKDALVTSRTISSYESTLQMGIMSIRSGQFPYMWLTEKDITQIVFQQRKEKYISMTILELMLTWSMASVLDVIPESDTVILLIRVPDLSRAAAYQLCEYHNIGWYHGMESLKVNVPDKLVVPAQSFTKTRQGIQLGSCLQARKNMICGSGILLEFNHCVHGESLDSDCIIEDSGPAAKLLYDGILIKGHNENARCVFNNKDMGFITLKEGTAYYIVSEDGYDLIYRGMTLFIPPSSATFNISASIVSWDNTWKDKVIPRKTTTSTIDPLVVLLDKANKKIKAEMDDSNELMLDHYYNPTMFDHLGIGVTSLIVLFIIVILIVGCVCYRRMKGKISFRPIPKPRKITLSPGLEETEM